MGSEYQLVSEKHSVLQCPEVGMFVWKEKNPQISLFFSTGGTEYNRATNTGKCTGSSATDVCLLMQNSELMERARESNKSPL